MNKYKKTFIYLIIFLFYLPAHCYSQQLFTFKFQNTDLKDVIKEISHQAKVNILYNPNVISSNITVSGSFKSLTLKLALDTFLKKNQILYKFYKNDIVLYKRNEEVKETHQPRTLLTKNIRSDKNQEVFTDTVKYIVIAHDTVITKLTSYVKIPVNDTIRVYDTVKVVQKINKPVNQNEFRTPAKAFIMEVSGMKDIFSSTFHFPDLRVSLADTIKSSVKDQGSTGVCIDFIYRNKRLIFETGVRYKRNNYLFDFSYVNLSTTSIVDTIETYKTYSETDTIVNYITKVTNTTVQSITRYYSNFTYQYLSVPVLFGYCTSGKKVNLEFKGGLLCNFYIGSKGMHIKTENNKISVENSKAPEVGMSLGLMAALGADFLLNERAHLIASPFASSTFISLDKKKPYTTDFHFGIQFGIRYYFFRK
jgi:hypothetical protein